MAERRLGAFAGGWAEAMAARAVALVRTGHRLSDEARRTQFGVVGV